MPRVSKKLPIQDVFFYVFSAALLFVGSFIFIFFEQAHFDSDQAISGLMAKDLSELKHFPIFTYGAKYVLGFETWIAAPFMFLFGASVATLKLPLFILNLTTAFLLIYLLKKETKLTWLPLFFCVCFFLLPTPIAASRAIHAAVGIPTSFLAVLLVWVLWTRPVLLGLLLGFVIPIRPFVLDAVLALFIIEYGDRILFTKANFKKWSKTGGIALALIAMIKMTGMHGPNYKGPSVPAFVIKDPISFLHSLNWTLSENIPTLFGLKSDRLSDFNIASTLTTGHPILIPLAIIGVFVYSWRSFGGWWKQRDLARQTLLTERFPSFLMLVGLLSCFIYTEFTRNCENIMLIRYNFLSVFFPIGYVAYFFRQELKMAWKRSLMALIAIWLSMSMVDHARLINEYFTHTPPNIYRAFVDDLEKHNEHFGQAPFWTAAHVTFFSRERILLSESDFPRIDDYLKPIHDHADEAVRITDGACEPGNQGARQFEKWCIHATLNP